MKNEDATRARVCGFVVWFKFTNNQTNLQIKFEIANITKKQEKL